MRLVWLDSETCSRCSRARHGDPRGAEDAPDLTRLHLFCNNVHLPFSLYWQALVRTRYNWKRPRRVVGKKGSDIHAPIPWMSVRSQGSVVARGEVSVSMSSSCSSSHKQLEASTSFEAVSTHETAQLLRRGVELNTLISRLGDTLRRSPRRLGHPLPARTGSHARCKSELFVCTISWVVSRMCECTMFVHFRIVNVLGNKRLSNVLHKCRFPSFILSFGIQLCLRLAESSARSSSPSED